MVGGELRLLFEFKFRRTSRRGWNRANILSVPFSVLRVKGRPEKVEKISPETHKQGKIQKE